MSEPIIELKNITKTFPGIVANDNISLTINKGEIFALLGENGAGKSTLMSILFGMYQPDKGQIIVRGKRQTIESPSYATSLNIGMVHQHFKLVGNYTVAENVILGMEPNSKKLGFIPYLNTKNSEQKIAQLSETYGLAVDPTKRIEEIDVSMMQRVEIIKMLYRQAEILIFDEPTAVLTPQEITALLEIIKSLKAAGKTIILITHKLEEIKKIADRCAILRKGKLIDVLDVKDTDTTQMANLMVGRDVVFDIDKKAAQLGDVVLDVKQLNVVNKVGFELLKNINLTIRSGEILAVAGVSGNGQIALADAICGLLPIKSGQIRLNGELINDLTIAERVRGKISYIPEDRQNDALILDLPLRDNMLLKTYDRPTYQHNNWLDGDAFNRYTEQAIRNYDIRSASGSQTIVRSMSGGNQQKAIIAREIDLNSPLMIFVQPTRGLDIGAIENIHKQILKQRDMGKAILLISLELDEVMQLADTIAVIYNGEILHTAAANKLTTDQIGEYMMGVVQHEK
ncbi:MAG: heme ABC transporter ATP-binding protein [Clostridiales bacterium]|nr:MAG: heme ABC transporter ATP-binding protein [Clostridiales bacterium]